MSRSWYPAHLPYWQPQSNRTLSKTHKKNAIQSVYPRLRWFFKLDSPKRLVQFYLYQFETRNWGAPVRNPVVLCSVRGDRWQWRLVNRSEYALRVCTCQMRVAHWGHVHEWLLGLSYGITSDSSLFNFRIGVRVGFCTTIRLNKPQAKLDPYGAIKCY